MRAGGQFQNYEGGVFGGCTSDQTDHAVTVVGYGTENGDYDKDFDDDDGGGGNGDDGGGDSNQTDHAVTVVGYGTNAPTGSFKMILIVLVDNADDHDGTAVGD